MRPQSNCGIRHFLLVLQLIASAETLRCIATSPALLKVSPVVSTTSPAFSIRQEHSAVRSLAELSTGFLAIMIVLWLPTDKQLVFGPIALVMPAILVLMDKQTAQELGFGLRQFFRALWVLPAAIAVAAVGIYLAQLAGTYHVLYKGDLSHIGGYVLWTIYQQFLLQDYFMPRLTRLLSSGGAITVAAVLFAIAHLPN